ncbi:hypothetical protein PIB30_024952 [Stylosanthes scabra]|uniref:Uncharacterized protein n=1 Tax=Stylosanthes scabra TaxID=79078 RepID=A0ABU6VBL7_9FABA|nr:hypothetical protein [Stylosanthes scabra]
MLSAYKKARRPETSHISFVPFSIFSTIDPPKLFLGFCDKGEDITVQALCLFNARSEEADVVRDRGRIWAHDPTLGFRIRRCTPFSICGVLETGLLYFPPPVGAVPRYTTTRAGEHAEGVICHSYGMGTERLQHILADANADTLRQYARYSSSFSLLKFSD